MGIEKGMDHLARWVGGAGHGGGGGGEAVGGFERWYMTSDSRTAGWEVKRVSDPTRPD